ncbi:hypothetical protein [Halobellus sp. EA9]|uniref:hypothetical protein n=1 Tax=Halobellus sp. EA9 TaxID=3421647 RepID=UPI003EBDCF77
MPPEFPPQQSPPRLSRNAKIGLGAFLVVTLAYSFVIAGQILLWFVIVGVTAGIYLTWLLVVAVFGMVDAFERIADAMEARNRGDVDTAVEPPDVEGAEGRDVDGTDSGEDT